jgi:hypothetical protein
MTAEQMFGTKVDEFVQYTVGRAWEKQTPQALRDAERELQGMWRFLLFTGCNDAVTTLRISNTQRDLLQMAEIMERRKL